METSTLEIPSRHQEICVVTAAATGQDLDLATSKAFKLLHTRASEIENCTKLEGVKFEITTQGSSYGYVVLAYGTAINGNQFNHRHYAIQDI